MPKIVLCATLLILVSSQAAHGQQRKADSQPKRQESQSRTSPTPLDPGDPGINNNTETKPEATQQKNDSQDEALRAEQARQNQTIASATYWMAIIAGFNLLVALIYAILAYFTLRAVKKQADKAGEQVTEMREQSNIARTAANAAELSAKAAEESARLAGLLQRPDLNLEMKFGPLEIGKPLQIELRMLNTGEATAYHFGIHLSVDWRPARFDGVLDYGKPKYEASEPIRRQRDKFIHFLPVPITAIQIRGMVSGNTWFIVYGVFWYEDGAGKRYEETFCRRWDRGSPQDAVECPYSLRNKMVEEIASAD